jgi:hypothetical protein
VETRIYPITFMIPSPSVTQIEINVTLSRYIKYKFIVCGFSDTFNLFTDTNLLCIVKVT